MNAITAEKSVMVEWRDNGRPRCRRLTLDELRRESEPQYIEVAYTIELPCGTLTHEAGRTKWSDPRVSGMSRVLWIAGDLHSIVEIADQMIAGRSFDQIWEAS